MSRLTSLAATYGSRLIRWRYPDVVWRMPHDERVAYLTFDDGPTPAATERLLTLLDRYDAKASFFLIGREAARQEDLVRAIHAAGHTIGNHTYTHPDAWRLSPDRLLRELERTSATLEDLVGSTVRWMRPPYGHLTTLMRRWALVRRQRIAMWDVMPADWLLPTGVSHLQRRILRSIRPGSLIVLHDNPKSQAATPRALAALLPRLRDEGWQFRAL